jgi:hypothetical protein
VSEKENWSGWGCWPVGGCREGYARRSILVEVLLSNRCRSGSSGGIKSIVQTT